MCSLRWSLWMRPGFEGHLVHSNTQCPKPDAYLVAMHFAFLGLGVFDCLYMLLRRISSLPSLRQ